jgi:hypothetical protein
MSSSATSPHDQLTITTAATRALAGARKLAVVTDAYDDQLAATRDIALALALQHDLDVVLYDRSEETWMDHPHPAGPCDRADLDARDRTHLAAQLDDFESAGVSATTWIATVPAISEIVDVIREIDVDIVLLPDRLDRRKLFDRLLSNRSADAVVEAAARTLEQPVPVLVHREDTVDVAN